MHILSVIFLINIQPRRWKIDLKGPDQSGFLTLTGRRQKPKVSQLSIDDDTDPETQKNSGSEPPSPSPSSQQKRQQPPLPPKPSNETMVHKELVTNTPTLPPRMPPLLPPRDRSAKDKILVQSASWIGGLESPQTPQRLDRHHSTSHDVGYCAGGQYLHKPDISLPAENGSYHKSPIPLPSTSSPDLSPCLQTTSNSKPQQHEPSLSRGYGKPPPLLPLTTSSHSQSVSGDYPPYDKLAPLATGEHPAYDRLAPITLLPYPQLPNNSPQVEQAPPVPSRSATDTQSLNNRPPPIPPKIHVPPPLPPKGTH